LQKSYFLRDQTQFFLQNRLEVHVVLSEWCALILLGFEGHWSTGFLRYNFQLGKRGDQTVC
jgi:hypothetical protein